LLYFVHLQGAVPTGSWAKVPEGDTQLRGSFSTESGNPRIKK
jgi:hypothetical protein